MLGKRLINTGSAATPSVPCTTNTLQILGDNSCVAYYKMSDATDETGSYDGTPTDVNFNVQGKFGNAGGFNGSSSYIDLGNNSSNNSSTISVSLWFKTSGHSDTATLINNGGANSGETGYFLGLTSSGYIRFSTNTTSSGYLVIGSVDYADGNWHHIVLTYTSPSWNIYVDGNTTPVLGNSSGTFTGTASRPTWIGKFSYTPAAIEFWDGPIDQVRIFNKTLSTTEVTTLYNEVYCVPTIVPTANFNSVLWSNGVGEHQTPITGVGFQPDLTWIKMRDAGQNHVLTDSVRGVTETIFSNTSDDEETVAQGLTAFNSNGFALGNDARFNSDERSGVAWNWKASATTVTNTDGTTGNNDGRGTAVDSQVRANQTSGFSIAKFTLPTDGTANYGHGLLGTPDLVIYKRLDGASPWMVFSNLFGANKYFRGLDTSGAFVTTSCNVFNAGETTVGIGNTSCFNEGSGQNWITYNFQSIDGFSRVGSYVGTAATDNPIVTGFRPAFVMVKGSSNGGSWIIYDNKRNTSNPRNTVLYADSSTNESTNTNLNIDFNSNGFVLTGADTDFNGLNRTYIYLAIAEEVFNPNGVTRNDTDPFGDSSELALYKFEDNADDAGGNYNGTWSGTEAYGTGYIDKAAVFNGSSSSIDLGNNSSNNNPLISISCWLNTSTTASESTIFNNGGNDSTSTGLSLVVTSSGVLRFNTNNSISGSYGQSFGTTVVNDGNWHNIVVSYNSGTLNLYLDGNTTPEMTSTSHIFTTTASRNFTVGRFARTTLYYLDGSIDQLRIFNRALDSGEALQLYNE